MDNDSNAAVDLVDDTEVPSSQGSIGKSATPLTDKLFGQIAECLDEEANDDKRNALEMVANFLWTGRYAKEQSIQSTPYATRERFERLLKKTNEVRHEYHT